MNRRRFMKLFGAVAAAGAVPAIAGADAALAYAEKQPVQVEDAMRRLVDGCEDLRRPFVEFARQADATALSAAKLEAAIEQIRGSMGVPIDLTPKRSEVEGVLLDRIARATRLPIDVLTSPYIPKDQAFLLPRSASLLDPLSRPVMIVDGGKRTSLFADHHEFGKR